MRCNARLAFVLWGSLSEELATSCWSTTVPPINPPITLKGDHPPSGALPRPLLVSKFFRTFSQSWPCVDLCTDVFRGGVLR